MVESKNNNRNNNKRNNNNNKRNNNNNKRNNNNNKRNNNNNNNGSNNRRNKKIGLTNKIGILDPNANSINPLTNKNYTNKNSYKELSKLWSEFPMYSIRDKAINAINDNQVVLITAGTGSGKTVLVPKFALHTYSYNAKIAITNPKKIPTADAANFAAKTLNVKLGEEVGYKYRGSPKSSMSNKTQLLYCTDGYISGLMKSDPLLKKFDMIIIDEAHERNVNIDLLLLMLKRAMLIRRDLKLIIMSATIDTSKFKNYFPSKDFKFDHVHSPGESYFPVEEYYLNKSIYKFNKQKIITNMDDILTQAVNTVIYLLLTTGGSGNGNNSNNNSSDAPDDILVFLTSGGELKKACNMLNASLQNLSKMNSDMIIKFISEFVKDCPFDKCIFKDNKFVKDRKVFCGELTGAVFGERKEYITNAVKYRNHPNGPFKRKVVFSTEVAESSITIKGLKYVIDAGLSLQSKYYPTKKLETLEKKTISQASHMQRRGRVGRTSEGFCFNLFSKDDYKKFIEYTPPPILTSNLTENILSFFKSGVVSDVKIPFTYRNKNNNNNNRNNNNRANGRGVNLSLFLSEFLDRPTKDVIQSGLKELYTLEAFDVNTKTKIATLSAMGDAIGEFRNITPTQAKIAILSQDFFCRNEVSEIIAMMNVFDDNISDIIPEFKKTNISKKLLSKKNIKMSSPEYKKEQQNYKKVKKSLSIKHSDHLTLLKIFNTFKSHEYNKREYNKNSNGFKVVAKKKGNTKDWCKKHYITQNACKKMGESGNRGNNVFQVAIQIRNTLKKLFMDIKYKSLFGHTIRSKSKRGGTIIVNDNKNNKNNKNNNRVNNNNINMIDGKMVLFDKTQDNIMMVLAMGGINNIAHKKYRAEPQYILCGADDKSFAIDIDKNSFALLDSKTKPSWCVYGSATDYGRPSINIVSKIPTKIMNRIKKYVDC